MFKKILVCLDGSLTAEKVMPYVTEAAAAMKSTVILVRAVSLPGNLTLSVPGFPSVPFHTAAMPENLKKEYETAMAYLEGVARNLRRQGIKTETQTLMGLPGPSIISYANENDVDLIAMATHGHSGLRNVLLGSVAEYIVRESGLPILMIKPE